MTEKKFKVMDLDTPPEILIKLSQVDPNKYGIWCKQLIKEGTKFGPFVGEKAYEVDETMDPAFIWEIVDVETKEFLFYINATNPRYGNWMRHINCARYFEEQNIVSEQEGIDIFYHAIKDIHPGEELLTWYEKSPVRKKKGKKKIFPNVKRARTGDESKVASRSIDYESVSLRGRKRTARKFWEMEEIGGRMSSFNVVDAPRSDELMKNNANNNNILESEDEPPRTNPREGEADDDEDWDIPKFGSAATSPRSKAAAGGASNPATVTTTAASSALNSSSSGRSSPFAESSRDSPTVDEAFPPGVEKSVSRNAASGSFFVFESMVEHGGSGGSSSSTGGLWKNGRRVFRCDICSGVYRHSFSLKRHYVRCHVNYKYLTRVDIIQCGVQPPKFLNEELEERGDLEDNNEESHQESKTTELQCNASPPPLLMENTFATLGDSCKLPTNLPPKDLDSSSANTKAEIKDKNNTTDATADAYPSAAANSSAHLDESTPAAASAGNIPATVAVYGSMPDLYRCNVCDVFFDTKDEIRNHLANHPESEGGGHYRQFSCSNCNMQFKHKQNLVRHEVVHTGAKPFSCQQCHKSFPTATNQKRHEKIHDGHRLTCDLCPATFTQTGDLKKHACKQHPESYNECAYCSKYFSSETALDNHLSKFHGKDVEANRRRVCDKKKAKKVVLEKDRAESRRLAVEEFGSRGQSSAALAAGAQEGEESYACTVCRKCFYNYSNMCRHRRLAHYKDSKTDEIYGLGIEDDDDDDLQGLIINSNGNHHNGTADSSSCNNQQQPYQSTGVVTRSSSVVGAEMGYKQVLMVARNVTRNLELFIEGTRNDLDKASSHIRWKQQNNHASGGSSEANAGLCSSGSGEGTMVELHLEDFNFPKGYQMPSSSILPVVIGLKENSGIIKSEALSGETGKEEVLSNNAQKTDPSNESLKTFSKFCSFCRMNFADPNGFEKHSLQCPPTSVIPPSVGAANGDGNRDGIAFIHDYSRKSKPADLAVIKFPELAKLPSEMFSQEAILDLSRHKGCVFAPSGTGNVCSDLRYPCKVNSEKPLDLTGCSNDHGHVPGSIQTSTTEDFLGKTAVSNTGPSLEAHPSCQTVVWNKSTPSKKSENEIFRGSLSNISSEINQSCILNTPPSMMTENLSFPFQKSDDVVSSREMTPGKKAVCLVCYEAFSNRDAVVDHQEVAHPNVDCRHAEVEAAYDITWPRAPNPVGQLNVAVRELFEIEKEEYTEIQKESLIVEQQPAEEKIKVQTTEMLDKEEDEAHKMVIAGGVDEEEDSKQERCSDTSLTEDSESQTSLHMEVATEVDDSEFVTCTKCRQRFHGLEALHNHISDLCGDYWRSLNERVSWVFVLRGSEIPVTPTQSGGASQPRKRGKFKWQQMSSASAGGLSRTSFGGVGEDSSKKQQQQNSSGRNGGGLAATDAGRKIGHGSNKVLTRKRSQEIGASVMSAMDDPDYYVRSKRRAIMQQQGNNAGSAVSGSRKNSRRQPVGEAASQAGAVGSSSNGGTAVLDLGDTPANCSMDEDSMSTLLLQDAGDLGVANGDDDDDDDYDPSKFMCIYCRHQFQYTRTLRKHVLEFCHVRRDFAEKGDYLDIEWEEDLISKVQPPVVSQPAQPETPDDPEETKRSGGKRKRKRNWYNRSNSNNSNNNNQNQIDVVAAVKPDDRQQKPPLPVRLQLPSEMMGDLIQHQLGSGRSQQSAPASLLTGSVVVDNQKTCNKDDFVTVSRDVDAAAPTSGARSEENFIHVEIYSTAPKGCIVQQVQADFPQQAQHQLVLQKQLLLPSQQQLRPVATSESTTSSSPLVISSSTRSLVVVPQDVQEKDDDYDDNDCCTESPTSATLQMTVSSSSSSASSYSSDESKNQFQSSPKGEGQKTAKKRRGPRLTMVKRKKKSLAAPNQPGLTAVDQQPVQSEGDANVS